MDERKDGGREMGGVGGVSDPADDVGDSGGPCSLPEMVVAGGVDEVLEIRKVPK